MGSTSLQDVCIVYTWCMLEEEEHVERVSKIRAGFYPGTQTDVTVVLAPSRAWHGRNRVVSVCLGITAPLSGTAGALPFTIT
jgi:hypothetical protein